MRYLALTEEDKGMMLDAIGARSIEELFCDIPKSLLAGSDFALPAPMTEPELMNFMERLAKTNTRGKSFSSFLGAGAYKHFSPAAIHQLLSRGEFLTCYTPYQPELSQGTLQALYEFQTLISMLTGMDVANASMYDGATATAEAMLMAKRVTGRNEALVSQLLHPNYRAVLDTYAKPSQMKITDLPRDTDDSTIFSSGDRKTEGIACVLVQYPNFLGRIENLAEAKTFADTLKALLIVIVTEPVALGVLRPPGDFGADIVAGEGQSFGLPLGFGGPGLGLFAAKKEYLRQMPGRLVGKTKDADGRAGYVVTLATREQHIRRERATSNICTNETLMAIGAAMFLSFMGEHGLRELARQNVLKADYAKNLIGQSENYFVHGAGPTFNEFLVHSERKPAQEILKYLLRKNIIGGTALQKWYPHNPWDFLVCVTETNSKREIDRFAAELEEAVK